MRIWLFVQPFEVMIPSVVVIWGVLHTSVAVALGGGMPAGLHPRLTPGGQYVNTGGTVSMVQKNT